MPQLYALYEHASGYALFHVHEVEEVGALLSSMEKAITDASSFKSAVKLIAFSPFKSGTNALDNVNAVSEGIVHDDLKLFLEANVPTGKKAKKSGGVELGVSDTRITGTIQEELGIKCTGGDAVAEVFRGLRVHFSNMVKGLNPQGEAKAQLGLGHSYSRAKVKFNVHRADNMIIQSIALLDQLDKDINTFSMRVREWYSYHFPEMVKIVNENYSYCRMVKLIGDRKSLSHADEAFIEKMEEITMDSAKAKAIIDASKMSMGMDISPIDLINIESFSARVISLTEYRRSLVTYLHKRMGSVAPNLASLIGDMVGARLISHAGSLTNLAKYPASTVQILGAEKALFRALKTRGNTPKYGLIFHSTFIGRAEAKNKGRISRFLANKCSIASRIDCFTEQPNNVFGEKLKEQVEERLKFFETGEAPRKNVDVMKEALEEVTELAKNDASKPEENITGEKKKKKKKKRKSEPADTDVSQIVSGDEEEKPLKVSKLDDSQVEDQAAKVAMTPGKKSKKKMKAETVEADESMEVVNVSVKSEKKKKRKAEVTLPTPEDGEDDAEKSTKKKKKAKLNGSSGENGVETACDDTALDNTMEGTPKRVKKKKKNKNAQDKSEESSAVEETTLDVSEISVDATPSSKKLKKKKKKSLDAANETVLAGNLSIDSTLDDTAQSTEMTPGKKMKKKKKEKDIKSELERSSATEFEESREGQSMTTPKQAKKRKGTNESDAQMEVTGDGSLFETTEATPKKVKKKKKSMVVE